MAEKPCKQLGSPEAKSTTLSLGVLFSFATAQRHAHSPERPSDSGAEATSNTGQGTGVTGQAALSTGNRDSQAQIRRVFRATPLEEEHHWKPTQQWPFTFTDVTLHSYCTLKTQLSRWGGPGPQLDLSPPPLLRGKFCGRRSKPVTSDSLHARPAALPDSSQKWGGRVARFCLQRRKEKSAKWACGKASILLIKGRNSQGYPFSLASCSKMGMAAGSAANMRRPILG